MVQLSTVLTGLCVALVPVNAHFLLNYPTTVGFNDDNEGNGPCGGFTVDFSKANVTNFYVGGDAIALTSTHPASVWLMRATLDQTAGGNWTNLLPAIAQQTLGNFCETGVKVPESFAGQKGVIQVIEDAVDGQLYQCAAVNFVSGSSPSLPSSCSNATGLVASFTSDAALSTVSGAATGSATGSATLTSATGSASSAASGTATGSSASATASKSAGAPAAQGYAAQPMMWGAMVVMGAVGAAFGL